MKRVIIAVFIGEIDRDNKAFTAVDTKFLKKA